MDKRHILREIKRVADANGGSPVGQERFTAETGIRVADWRGRHWARWSDALREAGYEPIQPIARYEAADLIEKLIPVIRGLGHFPSTPELRMARLADPTFPSDKGIRKWLGDQTERVQAVASYCDYRAGFDDVLMACQQALERLVPQRSMIESEGRDGTVYLIKSGRHYKIGRAFEAGRRGRDIALQLPERAVTAHVIKTDDPIGIEAYWHKRFDDRRKNGEWFELTPADVRAFKRRKTFM